MVWDLGQGPTHFGVREMAAFGLLCLGPLGLPLVQTRPEGGLATHSLP